MIIKLECKLAENSMPKTVWKTYSAFANTIGGTILLSIKEDKGEHIIRLRAYLCNRTSNLTAYLSA